MVAKCSLMIEGLRVSSRRLLGHPEPKSGSAGSRWRPQHTRKSRAARAITPVLQDKPRHSTALVELCSLILWSTLYTFWARVRAKGRSLTRKGWEDPPMQRHDRESLGRQPCRAADGTVCTRPCCGAHEMVVVMGRIEAARNLWYGLSTLPSTELP